MQKIYPCRIRVRIHVRIRIRVCIRVCGRICVRIFTGLKKIIIIREVVDIIEFQLYLEFGCFRVDWLAREWSEG
jgi:hypothetical protein